MNANEVQKGMVADLVANIFSIQTATVARAHVVTYTCGARHNVDTYP